MAFTYNDEGYDDPKPFPAHIREYGSIDVTGAGHTGLNSAKVLLGDASANVGCDASSYYYVWGITGVTVKDAESQAMKGFVHTTDGGDPARVHANDTADLSVVVPVECMLGGPFFWSSRQPIILPPGCGLSWDPIGSTTQGNGNAIFVYYTLIK